MIFNVLKIQIISVIPRPDTGSRPSSHFTKQDINIAQSAN